MRAMVAVLLLAATVAGCVTDWKASDEACQRRATQAPAVGHLQQLDARALGSHLYGNGAIEVHCDAIVVLGGSHTLQGVTGALGSVRVEGGFLAILDSHLETDLSATVSPDGAAPKLTILRSTIQASGFLVRLDPDVDLVMDEVELVPNPFFGRYDIGPLGGCDALQERRPSWSVRESTFHGVSQASLGLGATVDRLSLVFAPAADRRMCALLGPAADVDGLSFEGAAFASFARTAGNATVLRNLSGTVDRVELVGQGAPDLWVASRWSFRAVDGGVAVVGVHGWLEDRESAVVAWTTAPACARCPDPLPGAVVYGPATVCPASDEATVGNGAAAAFTFSAATGPAGSVEHQAHLFYSVDGATVRGMDGVLSYATPVVLAPPVLTTVCQAGQRVPVDASLLSVRDGVQLGCGRATPGAAIFATRDAAPSMDDVSVCSLRWQLPA